MMDRTAVRRGGDGEEWAVFERAVFGEVLTSRAQARRHSLLCMYCAMDLLCSICVYIKCQRDHVSVTTSGSGCKRAKHGFGSASRLFQPRKSRDMAESIEHMKQSLVFSEQKGLGQRLYKENMRDFERSGAQGKVR